MDFQVLDDRGDKSARVSPEIEERGVTRRGRGTWKECLRSRKALPESWRATRSSCDPLPKPCSAFNNVLSEQAKDFPAPFNLDTRTNAREGVRLLEEPGTPVSRGKPRQHLPSARKERLSSSMRSNSIVAEVDCR